MKLSIYVPDDRAEDIERWRERLNFSQMFVEAFDRAVAAEAAISKVKDKEMKSVVERLKREADGAFELAWKEGAKEGRNWAIKYARLPDLRNLAESGQSYLNSVELEEVRQFLWNAYRDNGYDGSFEEDKVEDRFLEQDGTDPVTYHRGFNQGFIEAVKHVWDEVKAAF